MLSSSGTLMEDSPFGASLPPVSDEPHHPFFSQAFWHDTAMVFLQSLIFGFSIFHFS